MDGRDCGHASLLSVLWTVMWEEYGRNKRIFEIFEKIGLDTCWLSGPGEVSTTSPIAKTGLGPEVS